MTRTHHDVVADGVRLRVLEAGHGPAVMLLHGLAASHAIWEHVVPALAGRWRVIAPDLAGHGASAKPDATYGVDWHARIVRALARELGVDDVVLVGSSLGGRIAIELGAYYPRWVRALVLAAPAGEFSTWMRPAWTAVSRLAHPTVMRLAMDGRLERSFFDAAAAGRAIRQRILDERLAADDFPAHARAVIRSVRGALWAERDLPRRLKQPVLLVWGRQDRLVRFHRAEALLAQVRHARLEVFERCGHVPMLEQPEAFVRVLDDFLSGLDIHARRAGGGA